MALIVQNASIANQTQAGSQVRELAIGDSSFLQHIHYDPQTFQLTVTTKRGAQYIYFYVFPATFDQFTQSKSKGRFFAEFIRGKSPSARTVSKNVGKSPQAILKKKRSLAHG